MSAECKFYFINELGYVKSSGYSASDIIAVVDVSNFGYTDLEKEFEKCFDTETPFSIYINRSDKDGEYEILQDVITDCYGKRLCYCSDKVRAASLLYQISKRTNNDRIKYLYQIFKVAVKDDECYIVAYPY